MRLQARHDSIGAPQTPRGVIGALGYDDRLSMTVNGSVHDDRRGGRTRGGCGVCRTVRLLLWCQGNLLPGSELVCGLISERPAPDVRGDQRPPATASAPQSKITTAAPRYWKN